MAADNTVNSSLEVLASVKEKELSQLRLQQSQQAQNTITSKNTNMAGLIVAPYPPLLPHSPHMHTACLQGLEKELQGERERISQLEADFDYNLSILDSRDGELAHYESAFKDLRRVVNALVAENSELKVSKFKVL